ncbi:methyltransferase domain-containing protein [Allorhizobium sp. BGMRC 0089]|uniref:class I SAM-dependent methyltransferase n=1 Tax=Allorhizobium sonneratiae TaxID=2934936 RepID=UPI00203392FA|nr:class I SAM-dependent methyltransferase [Allorhizobium sonneratiae]MCM2294659.1 methyltransferase domain-containing protein [Allorhizobium sonneratiae]
MPFENVEFSTKKQSVYDYIARQFAIPEGQGGVAISVAMRMINWLPYRGAISLLDIKPTADLLEIGHGPGFGLARLSKMAPMGSIIGVDRSPTMRRLARAKNKTAIAEGNMSLKQGTFERLPLRDESVDGILAVNVLYFVDPISSALAEARRVLRPGGTLSVYVTDKSRMPWLQFDGRETRHTFDERSLHRTLQTSDFGGDMIEIRSMWLPFRFRGLLAKITKEG